MNGKESKTEEIKKIGLLENHLVQYISFRDADLLNTECYEGNDTMDKVIWWAHMQLTLACNRHIEFKS
jgi:hypothetical protein